MNPKIVIRNESPDQTSAITEVTIAAFKTLEVSSQTEHFIVEALRAAGSSHLISGRRSGRPSSRAYCFLTCDQFRWHTRLVWTWAGFRLAGAPTEGHRQGTHQRRAVTSEKCECSRMLSRRTSRLLQKIWVQEHVGTWTQRSTTRGLLRTVFQRAYSAGQRRFPGRIQSERPTTVCRRHSTAPLISRVVLLEDPSGRANATHVGRIVVATRPRRAKQKAQALNEVCIPSIRA